MTPKLAAALRIHEPEVAGVGPANTGVLDRATERRSRFRVIEGLYDPAPSWQRRQALHRRFLGVGDVLASALAIAIVLALPGGAQLGPVGLGADRESCRSRHVRAEIRCAENLPARSPGWFPGSRPIPIYRFPRNTSVERRCRPNPES